MPVAPVQRAACSHLSLRLCRNASFSITSSTYPYSLTQQPIRSARPSTATPADLSMLVLPSLPLVFVAFPSFSHGLASCSGTYRYPVPTACLISPSHHMYTTRSTALSAKTQYTIDDDVCAPTDPAELRKVVQKHCRTLDTFVRNRPIAAHTKAAFESTKEMLESKGEPASSRKFILDSGCGTGRSTLLLGEQYPDHTVIGVDRSFVRLNRNSLDNEVEDSDTSRRPFQSLSTNVLLVRAELTDWWRCCLDDGWNIEQHHIFYPNPYPKKNRLKKRFYAHPSFPLILTIGGDKINVRSNWEGYLREFANSIVYASEHYDAEDPDANIAKPYIKAALQGPRERTDKSVAWTNFEKKYDDAGEKTYEIVFEYCIT